MTYWPHSDPEQPKERQQPDPKRAAPPDPKQRPKPTGKRDSRRKQLVDDVHALTRPSNIKSWVQGDRHGRDKFENVERFNSQRRGQPFKPDDPPAAPRRLRQFGRHVRSAVDPYQQGPLSPALPVVSARERDRRLGGFFYETDVTGLLAELQELRDGHGARTGGSAGHAAPASRTPAGSDVADLIVDITVGALDLHTRCLEQLGRRRELQRRAKDNDVVIPFKPDTEVSLRALIALYDQVDGKLQEKITRTVHSWTNAAKVMLSRQAPMKRLKMICPYCDGGLLKEQTLMVREDVSSDVICMNPECVDENGDSTRWSRSRWVLLLGSTGGA